MKQKFIYYTIAFIFCTLFNLQHLTAQSWLITGNNNTTALSKLGTTNFIPLGLYTDNTERVHIDEIGRVGIGINAPVNILTVKSTTGNPVGSWLNGLTSPVFVGFADNASSEFVLATASNTSVRRSVIQGRKSRGSLAAPTAVVNDDYLTSFLASGFDGSTFQNPATIDFFVDGVPSAGNVPARISFVTGSNQGNRLERLKVGSTGNFNFNNTQITLLQASGNVGIGTGAPERKLHVFNGSAGAVVANINSPLVVEDNSSAFINVLAPSGFERGILFGDNLDPQDGGIVYNGTSNALNFRTNGNVNRLTLSDVGNLTLTGSTALLQVGFSTGARVGIGSVEELADAGGFTISSNSDFVSNSDGANTLGSSSLRWNSVWAIDGTINTSDARSKTNIRDLNYGIKEIMKLRSTRFNWKDSEEKGDKLGLIAQELQKVLPEVVRDWEYKVNEETGKREKVPSTLLGVAYSDIIPVLIRGIQEQQAAIEAKDQQVTELNAQVSNLTSTIDNLKNLLVNKGLVTKNEVNSGAASLSKATLSQSVPNPSTGNTVVSYYVPNEVKKAAIAVTSINGAVLKYYPLAQKGNGQVTINAKEFAAGVYVYTLTLDGIKFDSKKMVLK